MGTQRQFWHNFRLDQQAKLPVESNIYEVLDEIYKVRRKQHSKKWKLELASPLPVSTLNFYQSVGEVAKVLALKSVKNAKISKFAIKNINASMQVKFGAKPKVKDVLELDIFSSITICLDVSPDQLLAGIDRLRLPAEDFYENSLHTFLHRPQQSGFLIFHEIVVGYLVRVSSEIA